MSAKNITHTSQDESSSWNLRQLSFCTGVILSVSGIVAATVNISERSSAQKNPYIPVHESFQKALGAKKETFRGLQIIHIGNPEEMNTLKASGRDAWYFFQEGNEITYWRKDSGCIESSTFTITR